MEFHQWRDMYHLKKKQDKSLRREGPKEIYDRLRTFFTNRRDAMSMMAVDAEQDWFLFGNPYYKIWPGMIDSLMGCKIDIEGRFLHLPFPTYEIRLPKRHEVRENQESPVLRSMLIHKLEGDRNKTIDRLVGRPVVLDDGRAWTLVVHYQFDTDLDSPAMGWYYALGIQAHESIADRFDKAWSWSKHYVDGYEPGKEFIQRIMKLAISVAFFGTHQHELVMPDIPNRFIDRYRSARSSKNESEAKKLLDKAKRMGHFGWNLGREVDLPRPVVRTHGPRTDAQYELSRGHIRSGHMRLQPYGPKGNPDRYELIFVPPTLVRPDLPMKTATGFRLRDAALNRKENR